MTKQPQTVDHDPYRLREKVISALAARDLGAAKRFEDTFPQLNGESSGQLIERLNHYWRRQLSSLENATGLTTVDERDNLVSCSPSDWLGLFNRGILRTVVAHGLPQQIV